MALPYALVLATTSLSKSPFYLGGTLTSTVESLTAIAHQAPNLGQKKTLHPKGIAFFA